MRNSLPKTLPGVVCRQMVRCGKVGCKCQSGALHGPYYYRFWREDGRLRKQYVPKKQLETVMKQCRQRQLDEQSVGAASDLARKMTDSIRKLEGIINGTEDT